MCWFWGTPPTGTEVLPAIVFVAYKPHPNPSPDADPGSEHQGPSVCLNMWTFKQTSSGTSVPSCYFRGVTHTIKGNSVAHGHTLKIKWFYENELGNPEKMKSRGEAIPYESLQ